MKIAGFQMSEKMALYSVVGIAAIFFLYSRRDSNGDGKPDSFGYNVGRDIASTGADLVGGVVSGTGSALYGALDSAASGIGAADSDCARYKAENNRLGILWACNPPDWFK